MWKATCEINYAPENVKKTLLRGQKSLKEEIKLQQMIPEDKWIKQGVKHMSSKTIQTEVIKWQENLKISKARYNLWQKKYLPRQSQVTDFYIPM